MRGYKAAIPIPVVWNPGSPHAASGFSTVDLLVTNTVHTIHREHVQVIQCKFKHCSNYTVESPFLCHGLQLQAINSVTT